MSAKKLSPKQAKFIQEYLKDLNATQAAIRSGYPEKTAGKVGWQLLENTRVRAEIDAAKERRAARVEVTNDDVLRELLRIATTDIGQAFDADGVLLKLKDMPVEVRRAISSVEVDELWAGFGEAREQIGVTKKIRFWDKTKSLELLGKHLKLFTDKVEHSGALTLEQLVTASMKGGAGE